MVTNRPAPAPLPQVDLAAARRGLEAEGERVADLVASIGSEGGRRALGSWSVAELATHVSQAAGAIPSLAAGEMDSPIDDIWNLASFTTALVTGEATRDPAELAQRIRAGVSRFLSDLDRLDVARGPETATEEGVAWLVDGVVVHRAMLVCHLLNELVVHGRDLAEAMGRPWKVDSAHAEMVLTGFIYQVLTSLPSDAMVDSARAGGLRACFDIRLRHGSRTYWVFDRGHLSIENPSPRTVDCHLSADPAALLMVAWKRESHWPHVGAGRLVAWGRRPWLGLRLPSLVLSP